MNVTADFLFFFLRSVTDQNVRKSKHFFAIQIGFYSKCDKTLKAVREKEKKLIIYANNEKDTILKPKNTTN